MGGEPDVVTTYPAPLAGILPPESPAREESGLAGPDRGVVAVHGGNQGNDQQGEPRDRNIRGVHSGSSARPG
jgi:hypothetical protein